MSRAVCGGVAVAALTLGGIGLSAGAANAAPRAPWNAIAQCESGGNWSIDTGNGYYGGLQFSRATWAAYGGHGSPAHASRARQIAVAERVVANQGWSAWSSCSARLGLHGRVELSTHAKRADHRSAGPRHAAHRSGRHVAAPATGGATYTVRPGDTLAGIAARHRIPGGWQALADASRLTHPDHIRPGQVLHLPGRAHAR